MFITTLLLLQQAASAGPTIKWEPREMRTASGTVVPTEAGWLEVGGWRTDAAPDTSARLYVMRLRSGTDRPGPPIIYLAGGPGSAGVPTKPDFSPLMLGLRSSGDVVLYDQRGTGQSMPSLALPGRLNLPPDAPLRSDATRARLTAVTWLALDTLRARGVNPRAYTTAQSVEDLEALRRALGAEQIVLWGHSYGSHLALAYLNRYPTRVARLMIGGVNGTADRWRLPKDGDVLLARIDSAVRADPKLSVAIPDFMGMVRRVLDRLDREPLMVAQDGRAWRIGRDEVATTIALQSGDIEFIKRLPQLFAALDARRGDGMARIMRATLHERPIGTAMSFTMHIASGAAPDRRARIWAEAPTALLGNAINWPWDEPGFDALWDVRDLGDDFRRSVQSDVSALLYSGTLDGRTSLADAETVLRGLSRGVHVIVDGASHMPHTQSADLVRLMITFCAGGTVASQHLRVPLELRGPDEPRQVAELQRIAIERGGEAAAGRLREMAQVPGEALTSYVVGTTAIQLMSGPRKVREAVAILEAGTGLFPSTAFLYERLGDGYMALSDTARANAAFARARALDPLSARAP
jgi:pimeloyl-ACP methyl ester carboxylesterase